MPVNKSDWKIQWKLQLPFKIIVFLRFAQIVAHVRALTHRVYTHMKQGIIFSLSAVWLGSSFGYKGFYSPGLEVFNQNPVKGGMCVQRNEVVFTKGNTNPISRLFLQEKSLKGKCGYGIAFCFNSQGQCLSALSKQNLEHQVAAFILLREIFLQAAKKNLKLFHWQYDPIVSDMQHLPSFMATLTDLAKWTK
ncbi:hypothetical protein GOBAR_AA22900 [Gossypium barbadense]|uniref:Uncharacterized protein n=1 Tax=Gossypium barbadense TaxID=3634 RepID=A0A2P5X387_GOSBA|nr:hypothetical protein GOBAR_AA22900 [Gossypium barbadense]